MRFRISILLLVIFLIAVVVWAVTSFLKQPAWLIEMRGKSESDVIALHDGPWSLREFGPTSIKLNGIRKRLKSTIPPDCELVRELRYHATTYVYYLWLEQSDDEWIVFDSAYHHEDVLWAD